MRDRGWVEFSVYPLFSPQSLIAEGTANYGVRGGVSARRSGWSSSAASSFRRPVSIRRRRRAYYEVLDSRRAAGVRRQSKRRGATSTARSTPTARPTGWRRTRFTRGRAPSSASASSTSTAATSSTTTSGRTWWRATIEAQGGHASNPARAGRCSRAAVVAAVAVVAGKSPIARLPEASRSAMICIEISAPGPPDVLRLVERPDPVPGPGEVLIRVAAAGVNRPDVMQRRGPYPPPPGASDIPGLEVAGIIESRAAPGVERAGASATRCARWSRAAATRRVRGAGARSACRCRRRSTWSPPRRSRRRSSPSGPTCSIAAVCRPARRRSFTAARAASARPRFSSPRRAASRVFATAGSDEKCRACEELGAERAINYRTDDFVEDVRELTGGRGVDLILDIVGGSYVDREPGGAGDGRAAGRRSASWKGSRPRPWICGGSSGGG